MGLRRIEHIELTSEERKLIKWEMKSTTPTRMMRCNILLQADEKNYKNKKKKFTLEAIAERSGTSRETVRKTLRSYLDGGLVQALSIKRNSKSDDAKRKVTEDIEVLIVSTMLKDPPEGYSQWTITLLHNTIAEQYNISRSSVGNVVKAHDLRPYLKKSWCIPPEKDPDYVFHMEDLISVYMRTFTRRNRGFCVDEKPFQLLGEDRKPIPMSEGNPEKIDSTYVRCGTVSITVVLDLQTGAIYQKVNETRTAVDFAETLKWISDELAPDAETITLVMDNLNTHSLASLYKAFPPEEALRIAQRFETHTTPVHASWLDMAEIAINVMTKQSLGKRIAGINALRDHLDKWQRVHNKAATPYQWTFTHTKARIKLKRVYPNIQEYIDARDKLRESKQASQERENES